MSDPYEVIHHMNVKALELFAEYDKYDANVWWESLKTRLFKQIDEEYGFTPMVAQQKGLKRSAIQSSSDEEIHEEDDGTENDATESIGSCKSKRNAAKNASSKITKQSQMKLNSKIRRPNSSEMDSFLPNVKKEKSSKSVLTSTINETNLLTNEMPPPADKPKRRQYKMVKKEVDSSDTENESDNIRQTRSKRRNIKKEPVETQLEQNKIKSSIGSRRTKTTRPDSDVLITEVPVPIVVISDCEEENVAEKQDEKRESIQRSQGAVKKQITKRTKKDTKTTTIKIKKEPIAVNSELDKIQEISLYEDAESGENSRQAGATTQQITLNTTHVIQRGSSTAPLNNTHILISAPLNSDNKSATSNCFVVLNKLNETVTITSTNNDAKWQKSHKIPTSSSADSLLTDDDTPKPLEKNKTNTKRKTQKKDSLFTDDDDDDTPEPLKKNKKNTKQETKKTIAKKNTKTNPVFSPYANSPVKNRVAAFEKLGATEATRSTRTKTRKLLQAETEKTETVSNEPAKTKYATPITNHKLPSLIPRTTDARLYRTPGTLSKNISAIDVSKFATTAKSSRAEIQEKLDEQKRRLEKEEAQLKKNAMLQAKVEEQRKKREEKQIKAKTAREEKEREKEEKLRQLLRDKDEKQQEELRKKQEWAVRMATEAEEKRKRVAKVKQQHEEKKKLYELNMKKLAVKPPPLPTEDLEDSEDSGSESRKKYVPPFWARKEALNSALLVQRFLPQKYFQTYFQMQATTPDLREIFETIDERALRRNSSAIWNTPPRYSTLPKF